MSWCWWETVEKTENSELIGRKTAELWMDRCSNTNLQSAVKSNKNSTPAVHVYCPERGSALRLCGVSFFHLHLRDALWNQSNVALPFTSLLLTLWVLLAFWQLEPEKKKDCDGWTKALSYEWLCADWGWWALGDWDMSLPMISFTVGRETRTEMEKSFKIASCRLKKCF